MLHKYSSIKFFHVMEDKVTFIIALLPSCPKGNQGNKTASITQPLYSYLADIYAKQEAGCAFKSIANDTNSKHEILKNKMGTKNF